MRDRTVGETFYMLFSTRAFATGIPTTLAGTPVVSAYEDNSLIQITAGITLGVDHDTVTGLNLLTIVATGANGFEAGKDYSLVITTGTVGGVSVVGEVAGEFSLGLSSAFTRLGAPAGASVSADIAVIEGQTDDIGVAGAGLSAIPIVPANMTQISGDAAAADNLELDYDGTGFAKANSTIGTCTTNTDMRGTDAASTAAALATVDSNVDAILVDTGTDIPARFNGIEGATFATGTDSLEAIRDRGDAAWTTGAGGSDRLLLVDTTIATLASQTSFTLTAGSADNDAYNNCTIVIEDAATSTQKAIGMVLDYVGSTKTVTLKEALAFTIATTDKVYILAENSLKSTVVNRQLDVSANGNAGIDWANVESPGTALDLAGTDIQLVDTTTTNSDMRGTDSAALASVATEARLAELDAANMPADLDAVVVDTGTTIPAQITALNNVSIADILASQLTESYAADGVAPTLSQALFLIQQMLGDFAIAGTTITVRKIDGSTTAATFTLDDATTPTALTRAT